jgi:hypothetical protein
MEKKNLANDKKRKKKEALTNKFSNEKSCAISQFHKWKKNKLLHGPNYFANEKIMH